MKINAHTQVFKSVSPTVEITSTEKAPALANSLNRELSKAPQDLMRQHAHSEDLWNLAKTAAVLGYMALGIGGFVATSIFAPEMILFVTFAVFLSMPTTVSAYTFSDARSIEHSLEKEKFARIAAILRKLESLPESELRAKFAECGLLADRIESFEKLQNGLRTLLPGFATMLYSAERTQELYVKMRSLLTEADAIENPEFRTTHLREAYFLERSALASQVNTAFVFGLLQKPFSQESLEDIGSMPMISAESFALESLFGERPPFFIFKKEGRAPILQQHLEAMKGPNAIRDLSQELFNHETRSKAKAAKHLAGRR